MLFILGTVSESKACWGRAQVRQLEGALTAASGIVEGTVEKVRFQAPATGYTVLRVNAVQASGQPPHAPLPGARAAKGAPPMPLSARFYALHLSSHYGSMRRAGGICLCGLRKHVQALHVKVIVASCLGF